MPYLHVVCVTEPSTCKGSVLLGTHRKSPEYAGLFSGQRPLISYGALVAYPHTRTPSYTHMLMSLRHVIVRAHPSTGPKHSVALGCPGGSQRGAQVADRGRRRRDCVRPGTHTALDVCDAMRVRMCVQVDGMCVYVDGIMRVCKRKVVFGCV